MRKLKVIFACVMVLFLGTVATVAAQSLTAETLTAGAALTGVTINCAAGTNHIVGSFQTTGVAAGPYPGTFVEQGTVTLIPPVPPTNATLQLQASYTIFSNGTMVTGTKSALLVGACTANASLNQQQITGAGDGAYQASISNTILGGSTTDSGTQHSQLTLVQPRVGRFTAVLQTFTSTAAIVTLTPVYAENTAGTTHTVTATVTKTNQPQSGVTVYFTVTGSVDKTGTCVTGTAGTCTFTYQGPAFPGADLISAFADANGDGQQDPVTEPTGEATKVWMLPASTPGMVTGGGQILDGQVVFGLEAFTHPDGKLEAHCNVIDRRGVAIVHVKCLTLDVLAITATHATFFGDATVNGLATQYRIDVDDNAEPGTGTDTFLIQTTSGYLAGGVLTSGNIQVHD